MTPIEIYETLSKPLDERERNILALHFGVDGDRKSLAEIGNLQSPALSRQRVKQILDRIRLVLGEDNWGQIAAAFPEPEYVPTEFDLLKEAAGVRSRILKYLRSVGPKDPLQYYIVHVKLDAPIPEHRKQVSEEYDDLNSCVAFFEDYGARVFGRYRYCTKCQSIKPVAEFYRLKSRGGVLWQICRTCNTKRQLAYAKARRQTVA